MRRRPAHYPLVALVVTFLALNARGTWGVAPSQVDFLSIDCGAAKPYTDPVTGINWVPDGNYTSVGTNAGSVPGVASTVNNTELQTLRYFKEPRKKVCYLLPVQSNQTYLLAASFWYGNYDGQSTPPVFNMAVDATDVLGINLTDSLYSTQAMRRDYIRKVQLGQTSMSVCLYQDPTSLTTPIISSLELRLLHPAAYTLAWLDAGNFLFSFSRQDFGGATNIRYPDDAYDRVWEPARMTGYATISTALPVSDEDLGIKPPSAVMQTAVTPSTLSNLSIPYKYGSHDSPIACVYYLYLADISPTATGSSRFFTVTVPVNPDGGPTFVNVDNYTGGANKAVVYYWENMTMTDTSVVDLNLTTPPSVDPPLVNGAELLAKFPSLTLPSDADDGLKNCEAWEEDETYDTGVSCSFPTAMCHMAMIVTVLALWIIALFLSTKVAALETIKVALDLTSWSGDPCLPLPYDWVGCSATTSPKVTSVKLDGYNLTGQIPAAFAQLTALKILQLSNNKLSGSIPESLATLSALKELILYNNNLTGTVPAGLQKPGLALDIQGNPVCGPTCAAIVAPSPAPSSSSTKKKSSNTGVIAGVVGGILGVLLVGCLLLVLCCCVRRRRKARADKATELPTNQLNYVSGGSNGTTAAGDGSTQGAKPYSVAEITAATQNFNRKIGAGGFGPVFYGKLASGREVAVKVSDGNARQGVNEFNNEVQLLSRVHHRNLVSLVGYCIEGKKQMLVYEFLHRGTVREHLYGSPLALQEPLDWKMRLDIAVNSALGLEYLHSGCTRSIIHRDVKSSNILLTDKYVAKVADFGLSRLGPEDGEASHVSTMVKGTAGYLDPEYWSTNNLTEKSDVFSFGVVLLELLCGRQPIDNTLEDRDQWNITEKVRRTLQLGDIDSILDPVVLRCHPNMDSVWKVAEIAIQSVEPKGVHRPYMRDVVRELREAIVLETGHSSQDPSMAYSDQSRNNAFHGPRPIPRLDDLSNTSASDSFEQYKRGPHVR